MKTSTEGSCSGCNERSRASWMSASALRSLVRKNIKYKIAESNSPSTSTAKQNQTQATSYHSPAAGITVSKRRQAKYRATTDQTMPKTRFLAQERDSGSVGPNKMIAPKTKVSGAISSR